MSSIPEPKVDLPEQKIVYVSYCNNDIFRIPSWINLENENQVKYWGIRYNVLHIVLVTNEELKINSEGLIDSHDYKYPQKAKIESYADYGLMCRCDCCEGDFEEEELEFIYGKTLCSDCKKN